MNKAKLGIFFFNKSLRNGSFFFFGGDEKKK